MSQTQLFFNGERKEICPVRITSAPKAVNMEKFQMNLRKSYCEFPKTKILQNPFPFEMYTASDTRIDVSFSLSSRRILPSYEINSLVVLYDLVSEFRVSIKNCPEYVDPVLCQCPRKKTKPVETCFDKPNRTRVSPKPGIEWWGQTNVRGNITRNYHFLVSKATSNGTSCDHTVWRFLCLRQLPQPQPQQPQIQPQPQPQPQPQQPQFQQPQQLQFQPQLQLQPQQLQLQPQFQPHLQSQQPQFQPQFQPQPQQRGPSSSCFEFSSSSSSSSSSLELEEVSVYSHAMQVLNQLGERIWILSNKQQFQGRGSLQMKELFPEDVGNLLNAIRQVDGWVEHLLQQSQEEEGRIDYQNSSFFF